MNVDIEFQRPSSEDQLKRILKTAYDLACKMEYEKALAICDWLIESASTEIAGYRERAAVKECMEDTDGAIRDLQIVISRFDKEPADFYTLGLLLLQVGETTAAIDAFSRALDLGEKANYHYYMNPSLLFRAQSHIKLGNYAEALADARRLPINYQTHIPGSGMRSKEQIVAEAEAALVHKVRKTEKKKRR